MGKIHVVKQGEHVARIAAAAGFGDVKPVWDHASNAALKRSRDPCVLNPGDKLFVPDKQPTSFQLPTDKAHVFVVRRPKVRLRVAFRDASDRPLKQAPCRLRLDERSLTVMLDAKGEIDQDIPLDTEACSLELPDRQVTLQVGHLDPVTEPAGQRARLHNLGYYVRAFGDHNNDNDNEDAFLSAVEEFQCDHKLDVDGKCGPKTQSKLKDVHGC